MNNWDFPNWNLTELGFQEEWKGREELPALNDAGSHICAHRFVGHLTKQGRIFFFQACFAYKKTEFETFLLRLWSMGQFGYFHASAADSSSWEHRAK